MKRYLKCTDEYEQDYSNIIGLGQIDSTASKYVSTLPESIQDNILKFVARPTHHGIHSRVYVLVAKPLLGDPDHRAIIVSAYSIKELRDKLKEYETSYFAEKRYNDTGLKALI